MTGPETRIQQKIQKRLTEMGVFVFKVHGGPAMPRGLPDLICCVEGRYLGLEVKTPQTKNNVSEMQKLMRDKIVAAGGVCHVVCSVEEAVAIVEKLFRTV
jgi:Holliday junction resolvase